MIHPAPDPRRSTAGSRLSDLISSRWWTSWVELAEFLATAERFGLELRRYEEDLRRRFPRAASTSSRSWAPAGTGPRLLTDGERCGDTCGSSDELRRPACSRPAAALRRGWPRAGYLVDAAAFRGPGRSEPLALGGHGQGDARELGHVRRQADLAAWPGSERREPRRLERHQPRSVPRSWSRWPPRWSATSLVEGNLRALGRGRGGVK